MVESKLKELPIEYLARGKYQPRTNFDKQLLNELATSIEKSGIIQPIFVRPLANNRYEIIAGERRWRAAQILGLATVPCLVKVISDEDAIAATTIENIQRHDLNPVEEAQAYQRMINEFDYTHDEIATIVGKSRPKISNLIRILTLAPRAQQVIIDGGLSEGHAKVLAGLPQHQHLALAMKSIKHDWSVRQLELHIKSQNEIQQQDKTIDPDINRLEHIISEHLGAEAKLTCSSKSRGGHLTIHYNDLDILSGILDKIGLPENDR